jgi:hypothetical protein
MVNFPRPIVEDSPVASKRENRCVALVREKHSGPLMTFSLAHQANEDQFVREQEKQKLKARAYH